MGDTGGQRISLAKGSGKRDRGWKGRRTDQSKAGLKCHTETDNEVKK